MCATCTTCTLGANERPYLFSAHLWTDAVTDAKDDLLVRAHNLLH